MIYTFLPDTNTIIRLRRMRWVAHVARMGEKGNMYRLFVVKLEGKRPIG
jgi:hypothetical protein